MRVVGIVLLIVVLLYLVSTFAIVAISFAKSYGAQQISYDNALAHWDFYENDYTREEVRFASGENELLGYVYQAQDPKGLIVFSHGIWSGPEEYLMLVTWFVDQGWDVFTYNYTAYNGSEGKWAKGLPQSALDLDAALTYIESQEEYAGYPRVLMGHSWGAYASTAVLNFDHKVDAVAAFSGFSDPHEISVDVSKKIVGPIGNTYGWCVDLFNRVLFSENWSLLAVDGINKTDAPVLLVHGLNDDFIYYDTSAIVAHRSEITNDGVEIITLDDPDQSAHNNYFTNADALAYYNETEEAMKDKTEEERLAYLEHVDIARANQPNTALYEQVEAFLEKTCF